MIQLIEDTTVICPFCQKEINVRVLRVGNKDNYLVPNDCPNCNVKSGKIETALNRSTTRGYTKTEKSYLKLGMKDRKH